MGICDERTKEKREAVGIPGNISCMLGSVTGGGEEDFCEGDIITAEECGDVRCVRCAGARSQKG